MSAQNIIKSVEYFHGKAHLLGYNTTCLPSSMNFHTKIVLKGVLRSKRMWLLLLVGMHNLFVSILNIVILFLIE